MEEWIEICRKRLKEAEFQLPPNDLGILKEKYLAHKRAEKSRRLFLFSAIPAAAAVILAIFLSRSSHHVNPERDTLYPNTREEAGIVSERVFNNPPDIETIPIHSVPDQTVRSAALPADNEQTAEPSTPVTQPNSKGTNEHTDETPARQIESQDIAEQKKEDPPIIFMIDSGESQSHVRIAVSPYFKGFKIVSQDSNFQLDITEKPGANTSAIHHSIPLTFGLDASVLLRSNLSLTTGLEVSDYHSVFSFHDKTENIDLKAYYLGIPLRMDYYFWQTGPLSSWIGFGGKVDRLVYGRLGTERKTDPSFHWSVSGNIGIQYELYPGIGLYFQPEISYYFKPSAIILQTSRVDNPLMLSLGVGLRFSL